MAEPFCRRCGQPIAWSTIVPSGKRVPLDTSPDPESGIYLRRYSTDAAGKRTSTVVQLSGPELDLARDRARRWPADRDARLWVPHFATCHPRPAPGSTTTPERHP